MTHHGPTSDRCQAPTETTADVIERQVVHLTSLVDDLLDVSRVTRGLVTIDRAAVDIRAVVTAALEQVQPLLHHRGHELRYAMAAGTLVVDGDLERLVQVVANDGVGIAPGLLPSVFDLFTQAERTPDRAQGGLGIGLALVRSIVGLHGGTVEARSDGANRGSTFTIRLPRATPECVRARVRAPGVTSAASTGRHRILVVDDNRDAADARSVRNHQNSGMQLHAGDEIPTAVTTCGFDDHRLGRGPIIASPAVVKRIALALVTVAASARAIVAQPAQTVEPVPAPPVVPPPAAGRPPQLSPATPLDRATAAPARLRWYGWQVLLADAAVFGAARLANSGEVAYGWVASGPIVHFAHGNVGRGLSSAVLRVGLPLAGLLIGADSSRNCSGDRCGFGETLGGALIGMVVAEVIDVSLVSIESAPAMATARPAQPPHGVELAPVVRAGRSSLGLDLVGRF